MIRVELVDMSMMFYCTELYLSKCNGSRVVDKIKSWILTLNRPPLKVVHPFKIYQHTEFCEDDIIPGYSAMLSGSIPAFHRCVLPPIMKAMHHSPPWEPEISHKVTWFHVACCKFSIHLRSLIVHHFGVAGGTELKKVWLHGHPQWYCLPSEFDTNILIYSKRTGVVLHTDRQNGDFISPTRLLKESRITDV
jgi:hypothetical protein